MELAEATADPPPLISSTNSTQRKLRKYVIGILLLLVVVFLWTFSNFVTQDLYEGGYEKPFLVTYLNTSAFIFYLAPQSVRAFFGWDCTKPLIAHDLSDPDSREVGSTVSQPSTPLSDTSRPLLHSETVRLASVFCFYWFIANWAVNASLDYTTVASSTILASTSGFFTLILGYAYRVETMSSFKAAAVFTSFLGVVLVSFSDSTAENPTDTPESSPALHSMMTRPSNALIGDFLALLSAVFYALYVTLLKKQIGDESRINMQTFFGYVGLYNIVFCWPIGVALHFLKIESFELPSSGKAWAAIAINMFITFSSDFIYVIAMLKTTPLVVTIGISLTIPLAILGDLFLGITTRPQAFLGAVMVVLSFGVLGWESGRMQKLADTEVVPEGTEEEQTQLITPSV